jgi:preprotein translocase subunit SecA
MTLHTPLPLALHRMLPRPGPVWGEQPQRPALGGSPPTRPWRWRSTRQQHVALAGQVPVAAQAFAQLDGVQRAAGLAQLRRQLRAQGLAGPPLLQALAVAATWARETLGWTARPSQLLAALALLDNHMVEMATGEGKTLAIALAAGVAALAGMPVHVVTANDYLASRDAAQLQAYYQALGLVVASRANRDDDAARRAAYAADVLYTTAKDLAFDHLRDAQLLAGRGEATWLACSVAGQPAPPLLMRGLCMALLDEADSILLDEAELPLILSRAAPQAARRAFLWQALALARQLLPDTDFTLALPDHQALLTPAGEARLAQLAAPLGGPWQRPRYRREAVVLALLALHAYQRQTHYLVREGRIDLLDEVTGRAAPGRVWSRGLHTLVALKEGLNPPPETHTVAQITFQRLFQRYWRLCGISGTLWEARAELRSVYGAQVLRVPLHQPSQRQHWPTRVFDQAGPALQALVARVSTLHQAGRPVLVGTESVAASQQLATALRSAGLDPQVLSAENDAEEALIVAQAGRSGQVTVATRLAGRGTDITLDAAALAAGGLHVINCQRNPSARQDRQLAGRAARHGDPGSAETWHMPRFSAAFPGPGADNLLAWTSARPPSLPPWLVSAWLRWQQRGEERRRTLWRHSLLQQDRQWERRLAFAGKPP